MEYIKIIMGILVVAGIIFETWYICTGRKAKDAARLKYGSAHITLEEKLARLEECGFKLADPFTVDDLLESLDRAAYEKPGWDLVLLGLAMTEEEEPWRPHCENLYWLDTECIEDHGDYKTIAEELVRISQGSLPLEDIEDYVDVEEGKAWLSFKFQGKETRIDCKVEDDWLDPEIFTVFNSMLEKANPSKTFIAYAPDQTLIIGCVTKAQADKLKALGTEFERL